MDPGKDKSRAGRRLCCKAKQTAFVSSTKRQWPLVSPGDGIKTCKAGIRRAQLRNIMKDAQKTPWADTGIGIGSVGEDTAACTRKEHPDLMSESCLPMSAEEWISGKDACV